MELLKPVLLHAALSDKGLGQREQICVFQRTNAPFPSEREMGVTRKSRALMAVKTAAVQLDWIRRLLQRRARPLFPQSPSGEGKPPDVILNACWLFCSSEREGKRCLQERRLRPSHSEIH